MPPTIGRAVAGSLAAVALTLVLAGCGASASPGTATPDSAPVPANASPPAAATPAPTRTMPSDAPALDLALETQDGSDIRVAVIDETGLLTGVTSGTPGDGASVPVDAPTVVDAAATSLLVTWSAPPCDSDPAVIVSDGSILIAQPACPGPTDAVAFNRVLILRFADPVDAASMRIAIQDGLDTGG